MRSCGGVRGHRHQRCPHRPGETRRRILGMETTPSVDGHFDRISTAIDEAFGTETEFRRLCRGGSRARRNRHRRHRPGTHRQGRRLPAGGDEGRGLSRDLPHGGDPTRGLAPATRGAPGMDSVNLDREAEDRLESAGHIVGRLQRVIFHDPGSRTPTGAPPHRSPARTDRTALGISALLQGRSALDQLAGPDVRRHAAGDRRRAAFAE